MIFSDFVRMLYPICGEAKSPSEFVIKLFINITEDFAGEYCSLFDYKPEYLKRIFNGKKNISPQNATFILSHLDKGKFADYIRQFSFDAIQAISEMLLNCEIPNNTTDVDVADKSADLFAQILTDIASRKVAISKTESLLNNVRNKTKNLELTADTTTVISDMLNRSLAYREKILSDNGRFAYLKIETSLFPDAKYFPSFVKTEEAATYPLLNVLFSNKEDILLVGEGGSGKTTSLLYIWKEIITDKTVVPIYIPLNDFAIEDDFLKHYIPTHYGFNADAPDCNLLLLLDGFNEISGNPISLIKEIDKLRLMRHGRLQVILTSRHEYALSHLPPNFELYQLQPLEENIVVEYLKSIDVTIKNAPLDVLKTPMMLSLFTQTCVFRNQAETRRDLRNIFEFKDNTTRGNMVYNYLLCQVAKLVLNRKTNDLLVTWISLFYVAPHVAYKMECDGKFFINYDQFDLLINELFSTNKKPECVEFLTTRLKEYCKRAKINLSMLDMDKIKDMAQTVLIDHQYLLVEEENKLMFRHQYFRDFLSALFISHSLEKALNSDVFVLPKEMSERRLPTYVVGMIGDCLQENRNKNSLCQKTILHRLLEKMPSVKQDTGYTLLNVMNIWRIARNNVIAGEVITGLDLTNVCLNGICFHNEQIVTSFVDCALSSPTLLSPWHLGEVPGKLLEHFYNSDHRPVYSPDDQHVLFASADCCILEWNMQSQICQRVFVGHQGYISSFTYTPDGEYIISASENGEIREWDRKTGQCIKQFHTMPLGTVVNSICISKDGLVVLFGFNDGTACEIERETGKRLKQYKGHTSSVCTAIYSRDERFVLTSSEDKSAREWSRINNKVTLFDGVHHGALRDAVYSLDGEKILTISSDATVCEWSRSDGKLIKRYEGYSRGIQALSCNSAESFIAVSSDNIVVEREYKNGLISQTFGAIVSKAKKAVISHSLDRILAIDVHSDIFEIDYSTGSVISHIPYKNDDFQSIEYFPENNVVLILQNRELKSKWYRWYLQEDIYVRHVPDDTNIEPDNSCKYLAKTTDGKYGVALGKDGYHYEYDIALNKAVGKIEVPTSKLDSMFYSPNADKIAISFYTAKNCIIKEWNRKTGTYSTLYQSERGYAFCGYSPDGKQLLIFGKGFALINVATKNVKRYVSDCVVESATFTANGSYVITCEEVDFYKKYICSYNLKTGKRQDLKDARYDKGRFTILSTKGTRFLISFSNIIEEWDCRAMKFVKSLSAQSGLLLDGCEFVNCRFSSPKLEHTVKQYGGIVIKT